MKFKEEKGNVFVQESNITETDVWMKLTIFDDKR